MNKYQRNAFKVFQWGFLYISFVLLILSIVNFSSNNLWLGLALFGASGAIIIRIIEAHISKKPLTDFKWGLIYVSSLLLILSVVQLSYGKFWFGLALFAASASIITRVIQIYIKTRRA